MASIIEVNNISKEYRIGGARKHTETFRELLVRHAKRPLQALRSARTGLHEAAEETFWALRNVNFDVAEGDVVGIIGRNGAGKSTLLKILSRITDPTEGSIRLRGRMASLLEVGTGFHPELTGRENIFLNGAILGMTRAEILSKFDEIVAFSEIEMFLDTPVKRYSSGMYVRLAFSVAAHLNPEILVVDEVLAVGDMAFQKKCLGKMSEVSKGGRTVLFVSHNMAAVEHLCQRGIVLHEGKMVFNGSAKDGVQHYLHTVAEETGGADSYAVDLREAPGRSQKSQPLIERVEFYTDGDRPLQGSLRVGSPLRVRVHFSLPTPTDSFDLGLGFDNLYGQRVFTAHTLFEPNRDHREASGAQVFVCDIPSLTLVPSEYNLRIWLDIRRQQIDVIDHAARLRVIESDYYGTGRVPWNGMFVLPHHWHLESPEESPRVLVEAARPNRS
jgi:lipopolysaccharide transport system ATP-binding protein